MNALTKIIARLLPKKEAPLPLGRWGLDYCHTKLNTKIDLSNEDHCGPCGQYAIATQLPKPTIDNTVISKKV